MSATHGQCRAQMAVAQQPEAGAQGAVRLVQAGSEQDARARAGTDGRSGPVRSTAGPDSHHVVRSWPLVVLAVPAAAAVWSGWVGIGRLTGFGVRPLPGIWDSLRLDTAVTLPVGVEAYAAYALRAWLSASPAISSRTRQFARWSAVGSLVLGMAGQVAWHLLAQAYVTHAPWEVTTGVSCLPVLVLGMAAGLAHLLRADAMAAREGPGCGPDQETDQSDRAGRGGLVVGEERLAAAREAAARLRAAGQRVSRRSLRAAGLRGPNAELGAAAVIVGTAPGGQRQAGPRQRASRHLAIAVTFTGLAIAGAGYFWRAIPEFFAGLNRNVTDEACTIEKSQGLLRGA